MDGRSRRLAGEDRARYCFCESLGLSPPSLSGTQRLSGTQQQRPSDRVSPCLARGLIALAALKHTSCPFRCNQSSARMGLILFVCLSLSEVFRLSQKRNVSLSPSRWTLGQSNIRARRLIGLAASRSLRISPPLGRRSCVAPCVLLRSVCPSDDKLVRLRR